MRAVNSYSTMVQLYARSGQLPLKFTMVQRGYSDDMRCHNCNQIETANHLFVTCHKYQEWRNDATKQLIEKAAKLYEEHADSRTHEIELQRLKSTIPKIFSNDEIWLASESQYYCGITPDLGPIKDVKIIRSITQECHYTSVRLAGRIWGNRAKIAQTAANVNVSGSA